MGWRVRIKFAMGIKRRNDAEKWLIINHLLACLAPLIFSRTMFRLYELKTMTRIFPETNRGQKFLKTTQNGKGILYNRSQKTISCKELLKVQSNWNPL